MGFSCASVPPTSGPLSGDGGNTVRLNFCVVRLELQAIDMGNHFARTCPATEIVAEHRIGAFAGVRPTQNGEQAGNQRHVDLQPFSLRSTDGDSPGYI